MNRVPRVAMSAFAMVAALAFATGCGNEEQNEYVDQVNAQTAELEAAVTDAGGGLTPEDPKAAVEAIDSAQEAIAENADALEAIEAPDEVADLHAQLVETTRTVADELASFQDALDSGNVQRLTQAAQELQTTMSAALADQSAVIDEINAEFGG